MADLTDWLLEQIAEDERRANLVPIHGQRWEVDAEDGGCCVVAADDSYPDRIAEMTWHHAKHIATWDPARVLAECAAKRRIIELHRAEHDWPCGRVKWIGVRNDRGIIGERYEVDCGCKTIALLALPYADRPGYLEEWRP